ncbi:MAG: phosphoglycolate phosphatase [Pseudomonadota bacterium]
MKKNINAVLFDLDGTLVDTAGDLGNALNLVLQARSLPPLSQNIIRPMAGRGCNGLLKIGLDIAEGHPEYSLLCEELLNYYAKHACDTTVLFAGMEQVLNQLEKTRTPWGIVTNKPMRFTTPLIEFLGLSNKAACVISGDTLSKSKPHPDQILHACDLLGISPATCLFVGDSEVDVLASKAAGSPVVTALYGYIPAEENPHHWNADGYINHPEEILSWLN